MNLLEKIRHSIISLSPPAFSMSLSRAIDTSASGAHAPMSSSKLISVFISNSCVKPAGTRKSTSTRKGNRAFYSDSIAVSHLSTNLAVVVRAGREVAFRPAGPYILSHLSSISFGFNSGAAFSAPFQKSPARGFLYLGAWEGSSEVRQESAFRRLP